MAVTLLCPSLKCKRVLQVPDTTRGHRVRCGYCGQNLVVPKADQRNPGKSEAAKAPEG